MKKFGQEKIRVLTFKKNRGKGGAVKMVHNLSLACAVCCFYASVQFCKCSVLIKHIVSSISLILTKLPLGIDKLTGAIHHHWIYMNLYYISNLSGLEYCNRIASVTLRQVHGEIIHCPVLEAFLKFSSCSAARSYTNLKHKEVSSISDQIYSTLQNHSH